MLFDVWVMISTCKDLGGNAVPSILNTSRNVSALVKVKFCEKNILGIGLDSDRNR